MLNLSQDTVQGVLLVMGNTEYSKFGGGIEQAEDLEKLLDKLSLVDFEGFVKLVLLSRGSDEVPTVSCNTAGKYMEVDVEFAEFIEGWDEKLVPKISKWIRAKDPVLAVSEGIAGILLDPKMTEKDSLAIFSHLLSSGLCPALQALDGLPDLKGMASDVLGVLSLLEGFGFGGMPIGFDVGMPIPAMSGGPVRAGVITIETSPGEDPKEKATAILKKMFGDREIVFMDDECPGCGGCQSDKDE